MVMPMDGIINAWEDEKDQMTEKLRYIPISLPILSNFKKGHIFLLFFKDFFSPNSKEKRKHTKNFANSHLSA